MNKHTNGAEFYGPAGLFSFLNRLRSKARTYCQLIQQPQSQESEQRTTTRQFKEPSSAKESPLGHPSIINYLQNVDQQARSLAPGQLDQSEVHSSRHQYYIERYVRLILHSMISTLTRRKRSDTQNRLYAKPSSTDRIEAAFSNNPERNQSDPSMFDDLLTSEASQSRRQKSESMLLDIENYFIEVYFHNLHLVHPILERESFFSRCDTDIRRPASSVFPRPSLHQPRHCNEFAPVYFAVLALGAIVAREDSLRWRFPEKISSTLASQLLLPCGLEASAQTWAKLFFEKVKASLPDVFQVCSLNITQALFLLVRFEIPEKYPLSNEVLLVTKWSSRCIARMHCNRTAVTFTAEWLCEQH